MASLWHDMASRDTAWHGIRRYLACHGMACHAEHIALHARLLRPIAVAGRPLPSALPSIAIHCNLLPSVAVGIAVYWSCHSAAMNGRDTQRKGKTASMNTHVTYDVKWSATGPGEGHLIGERRGRLYGQYTNIP